MRSNPDPNAYLQSVLRKDDVIFVLTLQTGMDGSMWYLAQQNDTWGYVPVSAVQPMSVQENADYLAALESTNAAPTPAPTPTPEPIVYTDAQYFTTEHLSDGTLAITGYTGDDAEIAIPPVIDGKSVTVIGNSAFGECLSLTSVTIPDIVTKIEDGAFHSCDALTSITFPDSITSIGEGAFWYCTSLTSVTIPASVTFIGDGAFSICNSLTSVTIPDGITSIGEEAFSYCDSLTSVTLPDSVTSIGEDAFEYCRSLTLTISPGSYAETYAKENDIPYTTM